MPTRWKLIALAFVAIIVCFLLIPPLATLEVKVSLPSATVVTSEDLADQTTTWIGKAILSAFALLILGVLAWVARHLYRRDRKPDA